MFPGLGREWPHVIRRRPKVVSVGRLFGSSEPSRLEPDSAFVRWGGQEFFDRLVERFYEGVEADPLLRPMYPEDLTEGKVHLALFLAQYWGGPRRYEELRGHPRLRMRHAPFVIGPNEADAWLRHMVASVDASGLVGPDREELVGSLAMAAHSLTNSAL